MYFLPGGRNLGHGRRRPRAGAHSGSVESDTNAKLKVQFQWPFSGAYWIIELGEDYDYAVVGHPNREYLRILAREPWMPQEQVDAILGRMAGIGYDISLVVPTQQPAPKG